MKKIISILIAAALLMSLMVSAFAADTEVPTLTVDTVTAEAGDTVTLNVTMSSTKYAAYGLQIIYDETALELVSIDEGDEALKFFTANTETGKVTDFSNKDTKVDGVIFTITFNVLETATAGTHEVSLAIESFNMADQSEIEVAAVAGGVVIEAEEVVLPTVTVGSATAEIGDEVTLDVTMSATTYAAYGLQIVYDATALELVSIDEGDEALKFFTANVETGKVTDFSNKNTDVDGVIFTITFNVLAAGEHEVSLAIESFNMADQSVVAVEAVAGVISVEAAEEPVVPEVIFEGSMTVETTDTYGYFDLYSLTAPVTGTYTFYIPAGLGVADANAGWFDPPIIDFYDNTDGYEYVVELTEGEVFSFYVGALTKGEWTITYTVTTAEGDQGGDEPIEDNYTYQDLTIGNNGVNGADIHWIYTAPEAGTLTLTAGVAIMDDVEVTVRVNDGEAQTMTAVSQLTLELQPGDVVKINVFTTGYMTITAEWETEGGEPVECEHEFVDGVCIKCGAEDPNYQPPTEEPDGTFNNPFIIDELPYEAVQESSQDLYYQWTATEDGILYVYYVDGMVAISGSSVASWEYTDGGKYIEVAAGDVITINYWNGTGFTVDFVAASDIVIDYIILESVENVYVELAAGEFAYYKWIATQDGDITFTLNSYSWNATYLFAAYVNDQFMNYSDVTLTVAAGDEVIFYFEAYSYAGAGNLTFSGAYAPCEHAYAVTDSKDATCTEAGYVTYTCSICGDTYTEDVAALGHTYEAVVTEPTCTEVGFTTYTCSACGDTYVADEVAALGHSWDEGVVTVEPAEEAEGEKLFTCLTCGETKTETIPALEHVHNYEAVVTAPTCTEVGFTTYTCACGDTYVADEVAALGHSYESVVTEPTCAVDGCNTHTCSVCGDSYTETIPATGEHVFENGVCTECGAADPNPGTGSLNIAAIALIAAMSVTAVVVTASKKED